MIRASHCGAALPTSARAHARFCRPACRAAHSRTLTAPKVPAVRFLAGRGESKPLSPYVRIVADTKHAGMWRLQRADRTVSDMVNLARAKDALAADRERWQRQQRAAHDREAA
jgi:hypothetical protein